MSDSALLPTGKLAPELLAELLPAEPLPPEVVVGPGWGQDTAILDCGHPCQLLVVTADPITFTTEALADYLLAVNLNDLATSGAEPRWLLVTLLLPAGQATAAQVRELGRELHAACRRWGVALVGGHTEVTPAVTQPVVCGQALGTVPRGEQLTSAGAQPGDELLLIGPAPVEGTALLAREARARLLALGFSPPRLAEAAALRDSPGLCVLPYARLLREWGAEVHALHDPTEGGLATAVWELALASGTEIRADLERVPVLPAAREFCAALGLDWRGLIASGCLLAAVAPGEGERLAPLARQAGVPLTRLGAVHAARQPGAPGLPRFAQDELTRL